MSFVPKPALEKLPLADRKDLRDRYESHIEGFETTISELLGTPFHIKINVNEVWAYNAPTSRYSPGSILKGYVEGFVSALEWYIQKYGEDGKGHFNDAVSKSELTVNANELGDKAESISADVKDGVFRILFNHKSLGSNQDQLREHILKAVEGAPRAGYSLVAKASIQKFWDKEIEQLTADIGEILNLPDVVLDPNFEANYAALAAAKSNTDWQNYFGKATFSYFSEGLKSELERQKFKGDSLLQEGFAELVPTKTFKLRVVKKTTKPGSNETIVEDGTVYIQMTADNWWSNSYEAGSGLVNLL
ncbi:hypothetical protein H0H93_003777 [Arthromyces matolae]|nr:hypothetical protein H0H93_003777 [Arthromyces matolae]